MIRADAEELFDLLIAAGFVGGIDCACFCVDGHYGIAARKAGQPKSDRWAVSCTPMERAEDFKAVIERGELSRHSFSRGTYTITDWRPKPVTSNVLATIARYRFNFVSECDLHDALAAVLSNDGIEFEREVILNPRDRIDFLAGRVGIEVKVNGSSAAVERQVRRYTESHRIDAVVLLTSCSRHASIARSFNGKPVHVVPTFRA